MGNSSVIGHQNSGSGFHKSTNSAGGSTNPLNRGLSANGKHAASNFINGYVSNNVPQNGNDSNNNKHAHSKSNGNMMGSAFGEHATIQANLYPGHKQNP
jgi:hypothetical protein